jgi:hypothetical protein
VEEVHRSSGRLQRVSAHTALLVHVILSSRSTLQWAQQGSFHTFFFKLTRMLDILNRSLQKKCFARCLCFLLQAKNKASSANNIYWSQALPLILPTC